MENSLYPISGRFESPEEAAQRFLDTDGKNLEFGDVFWIGWNSQPDELDRYRIRRGDNIKFAVNLKLIGLNVFLHQNSNNGQLKAKKVVKKISLSINKIEENKKHTHRWYAVNKESK